MKLTDGILEKLEIGLSKLFSFIPEGSNLLSTIISGVNEWVKDLNQYLKLTRFRSYILLLDNVISDIIN